MPWWTKTLSALSALRTKTRQSYKSWSKQKSDESKAVCQVTKAEYQRELRKSRNISFGNMRTADLTGKNLFSTLRTLTGKSSKNLLPKEMQIANTKTSDPIQILGGRVKHFFPSVLPSLPVHFAVESTVEQALSLPNSSPTPPKTDWELERAVNSLNYGSAPGMDGISPALIQSCFQSIRVRLLLILNACL